MSKRARATNTLGTRIAALQEGMAQIENKTRTPAPDTTPERLEVIERRLELLGSANYRYEEDILVRGGDYAQALLDPTYTGPGPARVAFLPDGTLSDETYEWRGPFYPWGNRVVNMIRVSGRWFIDTHTSQGRDPITGGGRGGLVKLVPVNGWSNYSEYTGSFQYTEGQAQRLVSGIVILSGLIGMGTFANGDTITTLPEGYRPDTDMIFPTLNGNNYRALTIQTDGQIKVRTSYAQSFITLDGIAFPAAGVATWTEVGSGGSSYANNWTQQSNPVWGVPAFWKDPYGLVWFRGLLSGGTRSDNATMINLPTTHRAVLNQHYPAVGDDQFGSVGAAAERGLDYKTGTVGSSWVSLGGVTILTQDAFNTGLWVSPPFSSGWANYNTTQFPGAAVTRRPDGLGMVRGLIRSGTVGATARVFTLPRHMLPAMTSLSPRSATTQPARIDLYGHKGFSYTNTLPGQLTVNFGDNGWVSLDGMKWMVGEL